MTLDEHAASIFDRFVPWTGEVDPDWTMNWLGVRTRASIQSASGGAAGRVRVSFEPPVPSEDFFEWLDLLESVVESSGRYTVVELGAGWGRWLVNAAAALRQLEPERPFVLVGVEAEPTHFRWLRQHLADNGIDPGEHVLLRAAVGAADGRVRFRQGNPAEWYGQGIEPEDAVARSSGPVSRLIRWGTNTLHDRRVSQRVRRVRAVSLGTLLRPLDHVDLIDADVQGAEADVFEAATDELSAKVARVHVGTHGTAIEERLRALFGERLGWECRFDYAGGGERQTPWGLVRFEDGAQSWLNPARRARP
jgi:FkbM family methyltransferase